MHFKLIKRFYITKTRRGCTALMRAANFGISHDFRSQDTVLFLLFSGANPRLLNNEGFSALHYAIQANNEQVVRLLVRVKIPVTLHTLSGPTCLHLAVKTGNANIIRDVITATPNAKDSDIHRFVRKYARPTAQQRMRNTFDTIAKSFIVCFLIGTVFWEYPQYIFVYFPATPELLPVHILLLILSSVTWCLWAKVVFGDPGFLPKFQPLYYEIVTKRLERQLRRKHAASFVRSSIDPYAYMRLCHLCECTQPMFVHHCSRCQRCVRMFDHHCLYLCNCIGLNNQIPFYFMLVGVMLCGFLNMLVVINMMCTHEAGFTLLHLANLIYSTKLILMSVIMLVWQLMKYYKRKNGQLRARKKAESESMSSPKERLNTSKVWLSEFFVQNLNLIVNILEINVKINISFYSKNLTQTLSLVFGYKDLSADSKKLVTCCSSWSCTLAFEQSIPTKFKDT